MAALSRIAVVAIAIAWLPAAVGAQPTRAAGPAKHHFQAKAMGTVVDITVWTSDNVSAKLASQAAFDEFERIDLLMTTWVDTSAVSVLNAAAGGAAVPVGPEIFALLELGQSVAQLSSGAFDLTVGAYRGLWKFDEDLDGSLPDDKDVVARKRLTGWRGLVLDRKAKAARLKKKGMAITLGGIAKGYAVDRAAAILRERGLSSFIVQAGGDLYVSGSKDGERWRVGIRDPRGSREATFAITEVEDATFSTSGDYERGFVKDGVRYHHILDPRTGRPATKSRSVTVMAKRAVVADAWSTALFVLGPDKGLPLVDKNPALEAVFVDDKNQLRTSRGFTLVEGNPRVEIDKGLLGRILILSKPTPGP